MSRLHLRYLIVSVIVTALTAIAVELFILTLAAPGSRALLAGAAFFGGWWANLAAGGLIGILAGRKAASSYTEPRIGRLAGAGVGVWVGVGAIVGQVVAALVLLSFVNVELRPGLVISLGLVSFVVSLIAAMIAGRETAHPPEEEEA